MFAFVTQQKKVVGLSESVDIKTPMQALPQNKNTNVYFPIHFGLWS